MTVKKQKVQKSNRVKKIERKIRDEEIYGNLISNGHIPNDSGYIYVTDGIWLKPDGTFTCEE